MRRCWSRSPQPGDNFVVAAAIDKDHPDEFENKDPSNHKDKVHDKNAGEYKKVSKTLTVWRKVHVEVDSFGDVKGNKVKGDITHMSNAGGPGAANSRVWVDKILRDQSKDLENDGRGRFQAGKLTVNGADTANLTGNGKDFIHHNPGINLLQRPMSFSAIDNDYLGNETMSGTVMVMTKVTPSLTKGPMVIRLNVTKNNKTPIDWPDFKGGTITLGAGKAVAITGVNQAINSVIVDQLSIPFTLVDDDKITGDVPRPDTSQIGPAFKRAYVLAVYDVGDNNGKVNFVLNIQPSGTKTVYDFDAIGTEASTKFWTVYLLGTYQGRQTGDGDPHAGVGGEGVLLGIVDAINGVGAKVFEENLKELTASAVKNEAVTNAHEIGHLFGGLHGDCNIKPTDCTGGGADNDAGLMSQTWRRTSIWFSDVSLDKIRSIAHP